MKALNHPLNSNKNKLLADIMKQTKMIKVLVNKYK